MALPSNYKQIAMNMPSGNSPSHMMSPGASAFNILKERLRASGGSSGERGKDNSSPFVHSSHGNPAFTPQKIGKGGVVVDPRAPKPPKPPEKPLMPFMRYSRKVWDQVKTANPELKLWEVSKIIAQMWKDAPETERQEFIDEYEADKTLYIDALKSYHATPEYGTWNRYHVNRLKAGADSEEPSTRSSSKSQQQERRLDIQPAEDDEDQDDGYTFKHVAYARFLRNHRLINEIFSDAVVPDVRSVVTTQRMQVLKRQVQSLTMHQMKLETELQQIEEKFEAKKRKFVDSSEQFHEELKKHCKPAVDEESFKKMVERTFEAMRRERLKQLEEPKVSPPKPEEVVHNTGPAPSAPNTTIRPNEIDKPDASEVLQPMETEATTKEVEANKKPEEPVTATEVAPVPPETEEAAESTAENMDIEPPTELGAHSSNQTNNPSDISHPAYVTSAPTPLSSAPVSTPSPTAIASSTVTASGPSAVPPHIPPIIHDGPQPISPHQTPHALHPEAQPVHSAVPPYGGSYVPQPQGPSPAGARPYYQPYAGAHAPPPQQPPYGYPPYQPYHQQYGPPPPSHYMARPAGMHYPEPSGPAPLMMDGQTIPPTHGHYGPLPTGPAAGPPPGQHSEHPGVPPTVLSGDAPPAVGPVAPVPRPEDVDDKNKKEGETAKKE